MKKSQSDKRRKLEDSAQQRINFQEEKQDFRNELFEFIVNSNVVYYAALLIDIPEENLFCGQIGEIQRVILDEDTEKNSYFLTFIDFENGQNEIIDCVVKKQDLLPLFSFDPTQDKEIRTTFEKETKTLKEVRDLWERNDVHNISTEQLKPHNKSETRFEIGQLVTVEVDVQQRVLNSEAFIIQAGQTGIISNDITTNPDIDIDSVEITFWSMPFGILALNRNELIPPKGEQFGPQANPNNGGDSSDTNSTDSDSFDPERFADSPWKKTIRIKKNYVFPLYCEALDYTN